MTQNCLSYLLVSVESDTMLSSFEQSVNKAVSWVLHFLPRILDSRSETCIIDLHVEVSEDLQDTVVSAIAVREQVGFVFDTSPVKLNHRL